MSALPQPAGLPGAVAAGPPPRLPWSAAWRVPGATAAEHHRHQLARLQLLAQGLPLGAAVSASLLLLALQLPWPSLHGRAVLGFWAFALVFSSLVNLHIWWRHGRRRTARRLPSLARLQLGIGMASFGYGLLSAHVLAHPSLPEQLGGITGLGLALLVYAGGTQLFAALPLLAAAWLLAGPLGLLLGWTLLEGQPLLALPPLLMALPLLSALLALAVYRAGLRHGEALQQADELARQRAQLDLLLRDFEADAGDWLFELDAEGRLLHVSVHLARAAAMPAAGLRGEPLVALLQRLGAEPLALADALASAQPLRDVPLPWPARQQRWSIKARPLFDAEHRLQGWRGVARDVTAQQRHQHALQRLALEDPATGLPNAHAFQLELGRRVADSAADAETCRLLLFELPLVDADSDERDAWLAQFGQRARQLLPEAACLARLGERRFALLDAGADALWPLLREALALPLGERAGPQRQLGLQLQGGSAGLPGDAADGATLLRCARLALKAQQASGQPGVSRYQPALVQAADARRALQQRLEQLLAEGKLRAAYRACRDEGSGRLLGFEVWPAGMPAGTDLQALLQRAGRRGLLPALAQALAQAVRADVADWPQALHLLLRWPLPLDAELNPALAQVLSAQGVALQPLGAMLSAEPLMPPEAARALALQALQEQLL